MKKLFILTSVLALSAISSMAQGIVNANNSGQGVFITLSDSRVAGGVATKIGSPATAAGFTGAGPGQVALSLFAAPEGTSLAALLATTPVFSGFNSASGLATQQGLVAPGGVFTLPTQAGLGGSALVEFVWTGSVTVTGNGAGPYTGTSDIGHIQPITSAQAGAGTPAPHIWGVADGTGITTMNLVVAPEPSTIALGGLGAAALLFFRRRSK